DGHTAVSHSQGEQRVEGMALRLPAFRIVVNSMSTLGSVGHTCGFAPSFTLGTGGIGGAISGDNITVTHLINPKRVGWELVPRTPADGPGDGRSGSVPPPGRGAPGRAALARGGERLPRDPPRRRLGDHRRGAGGRARPGRGDRQAGSRAAGGRQVRGRSRAGAGRAGPEQPARARLVIPRRFAAATGGRILST